MPEVSARPYATLSPVIDFGNGFSGAGKSMPIRAAPRSGANILRIEVPLAVC